MNIEYSYKIISVDKQAKTMEIVYSSDKYGDLHVGARLPWETETLEQIVEMYNPSLYWLEKEIPTLDVNEGEQGYQALNTEVIDEDEPLYLSKLKAFYSLAYCGLLDKADRLSRRDGSLSLREAWINESNKIDGAWTVRKCLEVAELIRLLKISSAEMDNIFVRGSQIDINNPKDSLSDIESELFDQEMVIWKNKGNLLETDYVEMQSYDKDKTDLIAKRQVWRDEIRASRNEIIQLKQSL